MTIKRIDNKFTPLITTNLTLTGAWQDLGPRVNLMDVRSLALWLQLDINDSINFRVRLQAYQVETGGNAYNLPIKSVTPAMVEVTPEFYEFGTDVDQNMILSFTTIDEIVFGQFQVQVGTVGVTAGTVTAVGTGVTFMSNEGSGRGL